MFSSVRSIRDALALVLLPAAAAWSSYIRLHHFMPASSVEVQAVHSEIQFVRESYPGLKEIGLLVDPPNASSSVWFEAQYELVPILVKPSAEPEIVLARLEDPALLPKTLKTHHLTLISRHSNVWYVLSHHDLPNERPSCR